MRNFNLRGCLLVEMKLLMMKDVIISGIIDYVCGDISKKYHLNVKMLHHGTHRGEKNALMMQFT